MKNALLKLETTEIAIFIKHPSVTIKQIGNVQKKMVNWDSYNQDSQLNWMFCRKWILMYKKFDLLNGHDCD